MSLPLLKVDSLTKLFPVQRGLFRKPIEFVHAVDGISFEIGSGQSLGGCSQG
jgi:ABC-type oligopeptide transport system ATPase subunit